MYIYNIYIYIYKYIYIYIYIYICICINLSYNLSICLISKGRSSIGQTFIRIKYKVTLMVKVSKHET